MKKRVLPVVFNVAITTDLQIEQRLAIIQSSPYSREWLASHMDFFMDEDLSANFGVETLAAPINYYDDILITRRIDFQGSPSNKTLEILISEIEKNRYVILDMYCGEKSFYPEDHYKKSHPIFIFGFDKDLKVFYQIALYKGHFVERKITFDEFLELYTKDCFIGAVSQYCGFSITTLELREDYSNDDNSIFDTIVQKLCREENGQSLTIKYYDNMVTEINNKECYTGVNCLLGIEKALLNVCRNNDEDNIKIYTLHKTLYMLYEHRKIILDSMHWIYDKIKMDCISMKIIIEEYEVLVSNMMSIYGLTGKYLVVRDINIIKEIAKSIKNQYRAEKDMLRRFIECVFNIMIQKNRYEYSIKN